MTEEVYIVFRVIAAANGASPQAHSHQIFDDNVILLNNHWQPDLQ